MSENNENKVPITVYLPEELHSKLKAAAALEKNEDGSKKTLTSKVIECLYEGLKVTSPAMV